MTDLHLARKRLDGANIQGYSRNGYDLQTQPIPEYLLLYAVGLTDNQTATFVMETDFIPDTITAKYMGTTGAITVTVKQNGVTIWTQTYAANDIVDGAVLPSIPLRHDGVEILCQCAKGCDFIWISVRQCEVLEVISPKGIT